MNITCDWKEPFLLEQKVSYIISNQAKHGCNFDERKAKWFVHVLTEKILKIDIELIPMLPVMLHKGSTYNAPFKMNGKPKAFVQRYMDNHDLSEDIIGGPFSGVWFTPFDPSKSARVKSVMLDLGWIPTEWNTKRKDFNPWKYKNKLNSCSYRTFLRDHCTYEEAKYYDEEVMSFIDSNFRGKSKNYMRAILYALGFDMRRTPTFDQIKKKLLLTTDWPTSPKITEDSFDSLDEEDSRALTLLKERMVWAHRRSLIIGLIENVRPDGKLSGEANPCATPTARMRHKIIVNIPAAGAPFGEECRSLFIGNRREGASAHVVKKLTDEMVKTGKFKRVGHTNYYVEFDSKKNKWDDELHRCSVLVRKNHDAFVGGDGAGLELRMLTHYLIAVSKMLLEEATESGNKDKIIYYQKALDSALEYREVLLTGDIHSHNQRLAGLPTRKSAKTFIYAFLYGAGDANLGGQLGGGKEEGAKLRETFLRECPCIPVLIDWVQDFAKANGYVPAIDGRKLIMRRDSNGNVMAHKALNTLLQAAGSITMKVAMCFLHGWNDRDNLDANQVIMMHDEFQFTVKWEDVDQLRKNIDSCVARAGVYLNMECPLASDSMLGGSWLDTH